MSNDLLKPTAFLFCRAVHVLRQAGLMAEILEETALLQGRNILVDGSMRDGVWYTLHVGDLRRRFPQLRVAIIHVRAVLMYHTPNSTFCVYVIRAYSHGRSVCVLCFCLFLVYSRSLSSRRRAVALDQGRSLECKDFLTLYRVCVNGNGIGGACLCVGGAA